MAGRLLKLKQRISSLELVPSSGAMFEVTANDKLVHSKRATGEFPDTDAVLQTLRSLQRTAYGLPRRASAAHNPES